MTPAQIDTLYRVATREARRRAVDHPRCSADELVGVAVHACVEALPRYDPDRAAFGAYLRGVARRNIIDHLRAHGPVDRQGRARPYARTIDDPERPITLAAAPAPDATDAPVLRAAPDTHGRTRLRYGGASVTTRLPFGRVRRILDLYLSAPYPSARRVAAACKTPRSVTARLLSGLSVMRSASHQRTLDWQAAKGETPAPFAHAPTEARRIARATSQADAARTLNRSRQTVWAHARLDPRTAAAHRRHALRMPALKAMRLLLLLLIVPAAHAQDFTRADFLAASVSEVYADFSTSYIGAPSDSTVHRQLVTQHAGTVALAGLVADSLDETLAAIQDALTQALDQRDAARTRADSLQTLLDTAPPPPDTAGTYQRGYDAGTTDTREQIDQQLRQIIDDARARLFSAATDGPPSIVPDDLTAWDRGANTTVTGDRIQLPDILETWVRAPFVADGGTYTISVEARTTPGTPAPQRLGIGFLGNVETVPITREWAAASVTRSLSGDTYAALGNEGAIDAQLRNVRVLRSDG